MRFSLFAPIPMLAILAACTPFTVRYDYDPKGSFANLKTYAWETAGPGAKARDEGVGNPIMDRRIRRIVERELAARGFRPAGEDEPDFRLNCYRVYQDRIVQTYTTLGPGWGYRSWGYGPVAGYQEFQRFREGSIVLEVLDPRTHLMLWQAVAEGALTGLRDPEDAEAQVTRAVQALLATFPPPARKG
jgi:hypothetical protein